MADWAPNDIRWFEGRLVNGLLNAMFDIRVIGMRHVPREGAAIVAANHQSLLDPPLIGSVIGLETGRIAGFFGASEYLKNPVIRKVFEQTGGIAVNRGTGDMGPVEEGLRRLADGRVVGIFPEGTRSTDGKLGKGRAGLGYLALKSGAPVVPICLVGAYEAWPKSSKTPVLGHKIVIRAGAAIYPEQQSDPTKEDALAFSHLVMEAIRDLAVLEGADL